MKEKLRETLLSNFTSGNFRGLYKNYLFQSLIILICVGAVLFLEDLLSGIIVASIGASSFIIFITPHTNGSRTKNIVGGYVFGSIAGVAFGFLRSRVPGIAPEPYVQLLTVLICAAAAAATTFLMISFNLVHPPSAALAIGVCAGPQRLVTAATAIISVIILCAARKGLGKRLKNLI